MLRLAVSASALALLSGAAAAADLPTMVPPPPAPMLSTTPLAYNWSGFYIGAHGGWAFGSDAFDDGAVVGGQIGFNWQFNNFVLGVEGDGSWADVGGADSLETIRLRGGMAFDRFLAYGTGGGAFQDFEDLGWVAGAGLEYAFTDFVSAGVEYLHYEFDDASAEVIRGRVNVTFNSLFGM
jgi:outer membrane immunogenic protein